MRRDHLTLWIPLTVAGVCLSSCAPAADELPAVSVVDSAGVEMITSATPAWELRDRWTASATPTLEVGAADGAEEYTLFRVGAVVTLPGDRIAIANSGTSQIRIYGIDGRHIRDVGGQGEGPGEFMALRDLWLTSADSIMTSDSRLSRITLFDAEGVFGRTISVSPHGEALQVFGRRPFDDGSLFVSGVHRPAEGPRQGLFDGGARVFSRYSSEGVHELTLGELPHPANWGFPMRGSVAYTLAPFTVPSPPNASDGEFIYLGSGSEPRIEKRDREGRVIRVIRWGATPQPVNGDAIERFRDERLNPDAPPEQLEVVSSMLEGLIYPDEMPVFQSLFVDAVGYLWVEQYRAVRKGPRRWWVFDADGRWLGEPDTPADLDIREVGEDYLLGVRVDDADVERVVRYPLTRAGADSGM